MKKFIALLAFLIILPTVAIGATQNSSNNVAAAGSLTGSTLAAGVTASSLTSIGTIGTGTWQGTLINPTYGGTGVNNASKTITLGGNLTTSGANALTFTTTGSTGVTLPTSGTLATTTGICGTATALANNTANTLAGFNNSGVYADVAIGSGLTLSSGTLAVTGGAVTTTGSPATGNLAKFSGSGSITNGDLSGDLTTSGTLAATFNTVNSNVGSFTNANLTVNAKGLITAASNGTAGNDNNSSYRVLQSGQAVFSGGSASTRLFSGVSSDLMVPGNGTPAPVFMYIDPADFPTVGSLTTKLRVRAQVLVNNTAPARTFTFGLYPITSPAGASAIVTFTVGTVVTGSDGATVASPAANSTNNLTGSDFAIPTAGYYAVGIVLSGALPANSAVLLSFQLEMRNT